MHAVVVRELGGPDVMTVDDIPIPLQGPDELLVRIRAAGVNPVDGYIRAGLAARPSLPYTPGTDGAGEVAAVGATRTGAPVREGDRVYVTGSTTGTYAEYALCRRQDVRALPRTCSHAQGAAVGVPYATASRALFQKAAARRGQTVLVHGASGGVGLATVQLAVAAGLHVIGTAGSDEGLRLVAAQGADDTLRHDTPDHVEQVIETTGGRGVDVVIEMRSDLNLGNDLLMLATGGRVVCVGNRGLGNEGLVAVNARDLMRREGSILGLLLPTATDQELGAVYQAIDRGLDDGTLRPVVSREYPLVRAAQAHRDLERGHSLGKLVLLP